MLKNETNLSVHTCTLNVGEYVRNEKRVLFDLVGDIGKIQEEFVLQYQFSSE